MLNRYVSQFTIVLLITLLVGCGGGGGGLEQNNKDNGGNSNRPPLISGYLINFESWSHPAFPNASISVQDVSTGFNITTATVSINNVELAYNPASGHDAYEGDILIAPGGNVVLTVVVTDQTYTVSFDQFASYPSVSSYATDTWYSSIPNVVTWSTGSPTSDAVYNVAVLDAQDPYANQVWPTGTNLYQVQQLHTKYYWIPLDSVSAGDRLLFAGLVREVPISNAAYGSKLIVAGGGMAPITVVNAMLTSISVTPTDPSTAAGLSQQFTAVGSFSNGGTQNITRIVNWTSNNWTATMDSTVAGLAWGRNVGTTSIQAATAGVSGSTPLSVTPALLLSIHISPSGPVLAQNTTKQLDAVGLYTDGISRSITTSVTWSSSAADVATISNDSGRNGLATGLGSGTSTIGAMLDGKSADTILTVTNWVKQPDSGSANLRDVSWDGSKFVAVGSNGIIRSSTDGTNWVDQVSGTTDELICIVWSGSQFVAAGAPYQYWINTSPILTSPDGITWTAQSSGTIQGIFDIAWSGSTFIAVAVNGTILSSPDGVTWTARSSGSTSMLYRIIWSGTQFVVAGPRHHILTSPDGVTWSSQNSGTLDVMHGIAWSGAQFVAVGENGTILTSSNATTWTIAGSGNTMWLHDVIWTGSKFAAVGYGGTVMTSSNGIDWTTELTGLQSELIGVAWSGSKLLVLGNDGTIYSSP